MIKELLEQLAPLDAQIAALRGGAQDEESQMAAITAHASELAELAVEEDLLPRTGSFWPATRSVPISTRPSMLCSPISLSSAATVSAGRTAPSWAASPASTGCL